MRLGFAGLGLMGTAMAASLRRAGVPLTVYNRSAGPRATLAALGATVAETPEALFAACDAVILMLADDRATDEILGRHGDRFAARVNGRLIINMGTHAPAWSCALEADILAAGGRFVEAPVSGSRGPAEAGALVAMLAGRPEDVACARPLVAPMCREIVETGPIPSAMAMKLSVNLYLVATVAALGEALCLARVQGVDLDQFAQVIGRGPLGSDVAAAKLAKMAREDFTPQATIRDVCKNAALVATAARDVRRRTPMLAAAWRLFDLVAAAGGDALDMAAVSIACAGEIAPDRAG